MFKGKKIVALIPARGGSKCLPRKNVLPLSGKPLIAWSIEQAKASKYIDRIIVSTEDKQIAEISKQYGAEVPFTRPKELATDEAKGIDVVLHAIDWLENNNDNYDLLVLLQPTSPLRSTADIDKTIELLFSRKAKAVVSVCKTEHHPYLSNILPEDGCMKTFVRPEILNKNRQELPIFYRLNGALYIAFCEYLRAHNGFFGDKTFAYIMPAERSVDIDTEADFKLAELLSNKMVSA